MISSNLIDLQCGIKKSYTCLSRRLKDIAKFVIEHPQDIAFESPSTIADKVNVPPSALIRFARAFGFNSFNEMKQLYRDHIIEVTTNYNLRAKLNYQLNSQKQGLKTPKNTLTEFTEANLESLKKFSEQVPEDDLAYSVKLLDSSETIYIIGARRTYGAASYLSYALHRLSKRVVLLDNTGGMLLEQANIIRSDDVLVVISFSPYANESINICEKAFEAGAKIITVTDSIISPFERMTDVGFYVQEAKQHGFRSVLITQCLLQSIIIAMATSE